MNQYGRHPQAMLPLLLGLLGSGGSALAAPLNDTGMTQCLIPTSDIDGYLSPDCVDTGQDGETGRDVTANVGKDGVAGFSFKKISNAGAKVKASTPLGNKASQWACTKDAVTGLTWEVKTADGGLRDKSKSFTRYSTTYDPKFLYGTQTDAAGYVNAVNAIRLCGASNWRLPSSAELHSIRNYGVSGANGLAVTLDEFWFPNSLPREYWTTTSLATDVKRSYSVYFSTGGALTHNLRDSSLGLRLVHD